MKSPKKWLLTTLMIVVLIIPASIGFGASSDTSPPKGFCPMIGYRNLRINDADLAFTHNTHPDDGFMPGSGVAGSAGKTSLDDKFLHFASLGLRYQNLFAKEKMSYNIDFGGLIGGNRDRRQNANDPRPAEIGSFVYSEASYGIYGDLGLAYHFEKVPGLYIGAEGQMNGIFVSHGWDRWDKDQSVKNKLLWVPTVGPKIGYHCGKFNIELSVQMGGGIGGNLTIGYFLGD